MSITHEITLDVHKQTSRIPPEVVCRQSESGTEIISASITKDGAAYTSSCTNVRLDILHADGTWARVTASKSSSKVTATLPSAALNSHGLCKLAHFVFYNSSNSNVETTEGFLLRILPCVDTSGEAAADYDDQLQGLYDKWLAYEQAAEQAESARVSAEKSRVTAEASRVSAETARASAETARATAETSRASAETARATAETSRASAETARATAETKRASAETARASAETARVKAEAARVSAENARVEAEEEREAYIDDLKQSVEDGDFDGATFTPAVSSAGVISWTNDKGKTNPTSVNIKGTKGDTGTAATIAVGTVTTGEAGTNASVTNSGTSSAAVFDFTIPRGDTGSSADNADSATKLATARTIKTNLASTSAASFDGTANVTPGVTGTLPIANGGTGNTTGKAASADKLTSSAGSEYVPVYFSSGKPTACTSPSVLTNLASTTAAGIQAASPRPGVTGTLPVANGGTGASTRANAERALTSLGLNPVTSTSNDTVTYWQDTLGPGIAWYNKTGCLNNQPSQYGYVLNFCNTSGDCNQLWFGNGSTGVWRRAGYKTNTDTTYGTGWTSAWTRIVDTSGGTAALATALTSSAGDANTPVYFSGGKPVACTSLDLNTTGSAAKLTTARTIKTNLASTSAASFDGSANITPGVSGTLPVANGGTGATSLSNVTVGKASALSVSAAVGDADTPVYINSSGKPVACTSSSSPDFAACTLGTFKGSGTYDAGGYGGTVKLATYHIVPTTATTTGVQYFTVATPDNETTKCILGAWGGIYGIDTNASANAAMACTYDKPSAIGEFSVNQQSDESTFQIEIYYSWNAIDDVFISVMYVV